MDKLILVSDCGNFIAIKHGAGFLDVDNVAEFRPKSDNDYQKERGDENRND